MQHRRIRLARLVVVATAVFGLTRWSLADDRTPVDYVSDIKPLFARHCVECHGPARQQAGLRVDAAALAIAGGDSGAAVVPGDVAASRLLQAVTGTSDEASQMPLDRPPLEAAEVELLRRWIAAGAPHPADEVAAEARIHSDHWAFQPVASPIPPRRNQTAPSDGQPHNPIDAFIQQRLPEEGFTPSIEADRVTLIRRVSLDLTGLPPTTDELDRFLSDDAPGAYERVVDRLLASPHYGERWGRHWLDAARYADSNGFTIDGERTMWPFRDWVVQALNDDMPFDRFTIEQLAGDLLSEPTTQQLVATGFHRNTLANQEGGTDDEQFRVESIVDRVNTTATVWMGLTIACAQCHDHKYDPLTQRDFYRLYAIFNTTADNNDAAGLAPKIDLPTPAQAARRAELKQEEQAAAAALNAREQQLDVSMVEWAASLEEQGDVEWTPLRPFTVESTQGATLEVLDDHSVLAGGNIPQSDTYRITLAEVPSAITGIRLETLTHDTLPKQGPGLAGNGNFVLGEFQVLHGDETVSIARAIADHSQDGHDISRAIDGDEKQGWAINVTSGNMNVDRQAIFVFGSSLDVAPENEVSVVLTFPHPNRYQIGRFRLSVTTANAKTLGLPLRLRQLAAIPPADRTDEQQQELTRLFREQDSDWSHLKQQLTDVQSRRKAHEAEIPTSLVMRELDAPRESHVHLRGNFLQRGAVVTPGVPAVLPPVEAAAPTRLDLARWLVDSRHPLTSRVTVNRIWQRYFGRGLVETENDFGLQGSRPTHPELLDWLAGEFMRRRWSLKSLHRLIVTSHTYRQSSATHPELAQADPNNKLLARQLRLRLEAEGIRDVALAASGLLSRKMGGPPVHPPQPEGIYVLTQAVKPWPVSTDEDRYRRGVYTRFWRSLPHPFLPTFDAPDANTSCTRRVRSNTPLQALTLANDGSFVELAAGFAVRLLSSGPDYDEGRVRELCLLALSRLPTEEESDRLLAFVARERARLTADAAAAQALSSSVAHELPVVEVATWTSVARVMMNLDEFITRE